MTINMLTLVDSPLKRPVTWEMFPFDDVIMEISVMVVWISLSAAFSADGGQDG